MERSPQLEKPSSKTVNAKDKEMLIADKMKNQFLQNSHK